MDPYDYDAAVIRAAETLIDKRRTFRLDLDAGDLDIYVDALEKALVVRREINSPKAAGATTIEKPYPHEYPKPTPSITVGTQVRLTGEVVGYDSLAHPERVEVAIEGARTQSSSYVWVKKSTLEVIRQPFKRGEVVYWGGKGDPLVVVEDEADGAMLIARPQEDCTVQNVEASQYERRP